MLLAKELVVDIVHRVAIILRLCQSLLTLAARPCTRLLFMFRDQSNMPAADNQTRDSLASAARPTPGV